MQAYATYSQIRDQVMRSAGLSSLTGTSKNAAFARSYLSSVGERLASQNLALARRGTECSPARWTHFPATAST